MRRTRFEGRTALVTGGSSGIGRSIVEELTAEGARVMAAARRAELLEQLGCEHLVVDVGRPDDAKRMVRETVERFGRLDVLVNCAGVAPMESVLDVSESSWHDTLAINLSGAFFAAQEAARHMVDAGGGAIVNVASIDAFVAESPAVHYCASKAAMVMMTRCIAFELGGRGVRCNAVAPGLTMTPMVADDPDLDRMLGPYMSRIPLRRPASPQEQAAVVLFLASDEASYVNGETVVADGGQLSGFWYYADDAGVTSGPSDGGSPG